MIKLSIWRHFFQELPILSKLNREKRKHTCAFRLAQTLIKKDNLWLLAVMEDLNVSQGTDEETKNPDEQRASSIFQVTAEQTENPDEQRELDISQGTVEQTENPDEQWELDISQGTDGETENRNKGLGNPLFAAIRNGIIEIVEEILLVRPQADMYTTKWNLNILNVSIMHRQMEIFKRIKMMKIPMTSLVRGIDKSGNTLLHHVALVEGYSSARTRPGPAYQLQDELKWFKRVKKVIPSHYARLRERKSNKTAKEIFEETHKDQLKGAQKWIKETSQSCSAVSVLVATVVFAAAYTVPGGVDEQGRPILMNSTLFLIFTIMDVISLWSSLTSVVTFLSVLTSPFEFHDFRSSLPRKLTIGFTLLFLSVSTTMVAFTATIFLTVRFDGGQWSRTFSYAAAFLPISIFALMQFPLYVAFTDTLKYISKVIRGAFPSNSLIRLFHNIKSKKD